MKTEITTEKSDWAIEAGTSAAVLSAVEVGLGSVCHAFHIPFSGQLLSLNQGFLLARAVIGADRHGARHRFLPATISNVAATLKSLSPAGKKLMPMLAISAQGLLFNLGTLALGANAAGITLGILLLSVWAFVQPVLFYSLVFGKTWVEALRFAHLGRTDLLEIAVGLLAIKWILALVLVVLAYRLPESRVAALQARLAAFSLKDRSTPRKNLSPARGALSDLFHPFFLASLAMTLIFFRFAESSADGSGFGWIQWIWVILRPLALGYAVFFALRVIPPGAVLSRLKRFPGFSRALARAMEVVQSA